MSVTVTKSEGATVFTVTQTPNSNCPLLCQLLATLCCTPVYYVSESLKSKLRGIYTALGTVQIANGLLNLGFGAVLAAMDMYSNTLNNAAFWMGGVFSVVGIMCVIAGRFPSPAMVVLTAILHMGSACIAVTAIVLYSVDISQEYGLKYWECNNTGRRSYYDSDYDITPPPVKELANIFEKNAQICRTYKERLEVILGGLEILMIACAVLQLCVTISCAVLGLKAMCKSQGDKECVEDSDLKKPLLVGAPPSSTA